ncbi:hypothetical protein EDD16DRAFT_315886 [Pisolithus croceorrhizus]|nr:hypothetical protein EV401DRAFT_2092716 [Pisolithus croceorrhizus]KAI6126344.1 hypothetical protein EDD16DRAFT_315886 [Pisolithus croceorrhizus]
MPRCTTGIQMSSATLTSSSINQNSRMSLGNPHLSRRPCSTPPLQRRRRKKNLSNLLLRRLLRRRNPRRRRKMTRRMRPKNLFDLLPRSTFSFEDRKRTYSKKDTCGPGGFRVFLRELRQRKFLNFYRVDFKYNEEVTIVFMYSNQISGFFNRLEASRKYLFGCVGINRAANDSIIAGVLILRVKMSKPVVKIASNYESYDYKKLDMENSEDKAFFEGALTWDLEIDNEKWQDGKNFK